MLKKKSEEIWYENSSSRSFRSIYHFITVLNPVSGHPSSYVSLNHPILILLLHRSPVLFPRLCIHGHPWPNSRFPDYFPYTYSLTFPAVPMALRRRSYHRLNIISQVPFRKLPCCHHSLIQFQAPLVSQNINLYTVHERLYGPDLCPNLTGSGFGNSTIELVRHSSLQWLVSVNRYHPRWPDDKRLSANWYSKLMEGHKRWPELWIVTLDSRRNQIITQNTSLRSEHSRLKLWWMVKLCLEGLLWRFFIYFFFLLNFQFM